MRTKSICLSLSVILICIVFLAGCAGKQEEIIEEPEITILPPEPIPEPEPPLLCPECGTPIPADAFYCPFCGFKAGDDGKELPWHTLASIDELTGTWTSESGFTINYPDFSLDGEEPMFSILFPEENDSQNWISYAENNYTTLEVLWAKNAAYRAAIDGDILSDENGTQAGYLLNAETWSISGNTYILTISRRMMIFIPEKIVRDNAASISISPDGKKLSLAAPFHFFSNLQKYLSTPVDFFSLEEPQEDPIDEILTETETESEQN